MPEVTITLKIEIPDGASVRVLTEEAGSGPGALSAGGASDDRAQAMEWMERNTPAPQQRLVRQLLDELYESFGLVGSKPSTGSRPYLNFYPAPQYGTSRAGAITLNTGRFYASLNPELKSEFQGAEPAEGKYLTCYIQTPEDVELALALMRRALEERGWEDT